MEIEDALEDLMKERDESSDSMDLRVGFTYDLMKAILRIKLDFKGWLFRNEGEVGIVQLLLPKGMADELKKVASRHKERCEGCTQMEECKKAGIYDDPVRTALSEIFKIGFTELAERATRDRLNGLRR